MSAYMSDSDDSDAQPPLACPLVSPTISEGKFPTQEGPVTVTEVEIGLSKIPIKFVFAPSDIPLAISAPHVFMHGLLADGELHGPFSPNASQETLPRIVEKSDPQDEKNAFSSAPKQDYHIGGLRKLYVNASLSHGRVWDAFNGKLQKYLKRNMFVEESVIIKMTDPQRFPREASHGMFTCWEARKAVFQECEFYSKYLKKLQGEIVPRSYGLWGGRLKLGDEDEEGLWCEVWTMILEDCGPPVNVATLTDDERNEIVTLYRKLHRHGVLHGDPDPRHWRLHPEGGFRLIDFDSATMLPRGKKAMMAMEDEIELVKNHLIEEDDVWYI
ncbi:hypothetical protein L204_105395 [Cryptococcus depauperatus]|nr:hypothetical protein L204_02835 [Cryptococcus depauperatus CBS 7855]